MSTLYAAKVSDIPKEKKPRTEKQVAAFAKAQETRKRKREEAERLKEEEIKEKAEELAQASKQLEEAEEKKRIANEKRRLAREAKKAEKPVEEVAPVVEVEPLPKRLRPGVSDPPVLVAPPPVPAPDQSDHPPNWFKKYVENVKQNENGVSGARKAQKVVKQEAREFADQKWSQPNVRAQVAKSVDTHLDRMYKEIFCIRG